MKHLPNTITLANLFCGCIAIAFILHSQPFLREVNGTQVWITGTQQAWLGSIFIFIAALLDLFDGAAAKWLGVESAIGKDLDSLADVVSFGVAPSMILMKMLWTAWMSRPGAVDIPILLLSPAFLLACFAALRLAKYNNIEGEKKSFQGVPVPAIAIVVASFPLISFYMPEYSVLLQNVWFLLLVIALLSYMMHSKFNFFSFKMKDLSWKNNMPQYLWLVLSVAAIFFLKWLAIPFSFLLYIILSVGMQKKLEN